ncbi:MAG TPA: hypothetical protein VG778_01960, partial [Blastocatellia bacterium]|nr:hypothetical protein [Blastocatellia bacterium]
ERMGINEIRLADGTERELGQRRWVHVSFKSWLQDGSGLIVSARDQSTPASRLWFVAYPSGEACPLSNEFDSFKHARPTGDASMLVAEQVGVVSDVWSGLLTDSGSAKKIGVWGKEGISIVPDGRIVFPAIQTGQISKIWIMNGDGADRKQLTTDNSQDISAVVSPDGRYIVFASDRSGNFEIWRMDIDGSNPLQLTHGKGANPPSITPDCRWVIYLSSEDGILYKVPIGGGQPVRVVDNAVGYSAVSPDGRLIAYFAKGKSSWEIAVSSFHDGSRVRTFEAGPYSLNNTSLKWTPDGNALLYSKSSGGVANIWMQLLDGSPAKQVTDFKADGIFRFDVSADGKTLVCSRGGYRHDIVLIKNLR